MHLTAVVFVFQVPMVLPLRKDALPMTFHGGDERRPLLDRDRLAGRPKFTVRWPLVAQRPRQFVGLTPG